MDMALDLSGDYKTDENGLPYIIDGEDETAQQAYIMLTADAGGYIYDRGLGCGEYNDKAQLEAAAREALREIPDVEVIGAEMSQEEEYVMISVSGQERRIDIRRNE